MRELLRLFTLTLCSATAVSCHQPSPGPNPESGAAASGVRLSAPAREVATASDEPGNSAPITRSEPIVQTHSVRGVVEELRAGTQTVVIRHEAVPDFMPAMTMPFRAMDEKELQNLAPGDEVTFRLNVSDEDNWIDQVAKTGRTVRMDTPAPETVRNIRPLKVGDAVPDFVLTDERGQAISLGQFRGKALAVTFIFTRCPVPNFCRRMSSNFAEAAAQLKAGKVPGNWHLLSISFDPEFDTPATLKQYAERYGYDPATWSFAVPETSDVDAVAGRFGLVVRRTANDLDHNLRTFVIDTEGRIRKVFVGNEWTTNDLVREIVKAMRVRRRA